jgi:glyoxalase family protein
MIRAPTISITATRPAGPGSILPFFPWPGGPRGRLGTGQAATVALAVPPASLGFWIERLLAQGVKYEGPARRFDEQVLAFSDPDGLLLELVASSCGTQAPAWLEGPLPPEHAIRGLHGTTLWEDGDAGSADFLQQTMGFEPAGEENSLLRFQPATAREPSSIFAGRRGFGAEPVG